MGNLRENHRCSRATHKGYSFLFLLYVKASNKQHDSHSVSHVCECRQQTSMEAAVVHSITRCEGKHQGWGDEWGEGGAGGQNRTTAINLVKGAGAVKALSSFCRSCRLTTLSGSVSPGINTIPAPWHISSTSKVLPTQVDLHSSDMQASGSPGDHVCSKADWKEQAVWSLYLLKG